MMWFKDHFEGGFGGSGPIDIFWLMFLQDNTGRFDDRDDFDCDGSAPAGWKPWTDAPRSGRMNIAFEVNPATEVVSLHIEELIGGNDDRDEEGFDILYDYGSAGSENHAHSSLVEPWLQFDGQQRGRLCLAGAVANWP